MEEKSKPGLLKTINVTDNEFQLVLEYLEKIYNGDSTFDILYNLFDKEDFLRFCDIFSGQTVRVPKREELYKILTYIKIFAYIHVRGLDEASVASASKQFDKKPASIIRIYKKVDEVLTSDLKDFILSRRDY